MVNERHRPMKDKIPNNLANTNLYVRKMTVKLHRAEAMQLLPSKEKTNCIIWRWKDGMRPNPTANDN